MTDLLVTAEWLSERLGDPDVKAVDASWYLPAQNRDAKAEFLAGHVPGAVFFDIDAISDRDTDLPHMLPEASAFVEAAGVLGLSESDTIVVYDGAGLCSAPRVWWTLRVFGASDVRILDGGLPAWRRAGYPLETGEPQVRAATFRALLAEDAVRDMAQIASALSQNSETVVDARPAARFAGAAAEPRPGLASGHMPGAKNVPVDRLVDESGRLVAPESILGAFQAAGVDLSLPVVTTCGSGVTAAVLLFALATLGKRDVALYDGSWAEWGSRPGNPIATGPA